MWKDTAIRMLIGASGMAMGALFVLMLQGAAQSDAERLQVAHARANAVAAASVGQPAPIALLEARVAKQKHRVP